MESFNKKMQEKFEDSSVDIPDELSWDTLGPGILEGVKKEPKSKKRPIILLFVSIGLLGIIFSSILIYNSFKNRHDYSAQIENNQGHKSNTELLNNTNEKNQTNSPSNFTNTSEIEQNHIEVTQINDTSETNFSATKNRALNVKENKVSSKQAKEYNSNQFVKNAISNDLGLNYKKTTISLADGILSSSNDNANRTSVQNSEIQDAKENSNLSNAVNLIEQRPKYGFTALVNFPLFLQTNASIQAVNVELKKSENQHNSNQQDEKKTKQIKHSIGIASGLVMWNFQSKEFELETFETTLPSWNTGLNYSLKLNNRLSFVTGLDYSAYRSRLAHTFTTVSEEFNENAVQNVHNLVTGKSHQVVGAIETITTRRQIIHYNTLHALSIPLLIQYEIPLTKKFSYGVQGGIRLNRIIKREGRSISPQFQLLEYSETSSSNLNYVSGIFSIFGSYKVKENLSIDLQFNTNQALHSFEFSSDDQRSISSNNIKVGLNKYF